MAIYQSLKVLPYVYWGTHKETGEFYIGARWANKVPSSDDLETYYTTSSDSVKDKGFENFEWYVVAEFFSGDDAFDCEQRLIKEHIDHPLCLNGNYFDVDSGKKRFKPTKEGAKKSADALRGRKQSPEHIKNAADAKRGRKQSIEHTKKHADALRGRKQSPEHIKKRADAHQKTWLITTPTGEQLTITGLKQFCRDSGLDSSNMCAVAKGKVKQHKGYRCSLVC